MQPKDIKGKLKIHLVPKELIFGIAEVFAFGEQKYGGPLDYREFDSMSVDKLKYEQEIHYDALMRHLLKYASGEIKDDESGLNHLKHAASNLSSLLYVSEKLKINLGDDLDENCN